MKTTISLLALSLCIISGCKNCPECPEIASQDQDTVYVKDTVTLQSKEEIPSIQLENKLLYYKCKNILTSSLPEGYTNLVIRSSSTNTSVNPLINGVRYEIESGDKNMVLTFTADNENGDKFEWAQSYRVIKPPLPTIELLVNGKQYNGTSVIPKTSRCVVRVVPDNDFKAQYPKDARYVVGSIDLMVQRSLGAPTKVRSFSGVGRDASQGISISLGSILRNDPPGTKIFFKINNLYRLDSKNRKIAIPLKPIDQIIGALIK